MSTKLSEVYRSAFLRVLQRFYSMGLLDKDLYLEYAYATNPVDLSFWEIAPERSPNWWPQLSNPDPGNSHLVQVGLKRPIESLLDEGKEHSLMAAEGALAPANAWDGTELMHSFSLIGFGYKTVGSQMPTAEEVAEVLFESSPTVLLIPSRANHPFAFLDNYPGFFPIQEEPVRVKDLIIYPLLVRIRDLTISLWQFFRDYKGLFLLSPTFHRGLRMERQEGPLRYESEGGIIASFHDWIEGLKERNNFDLPLPHGQWVEIDAHFLESFLTANGLRLGYILKTSYRQKKHTYGEVETFDQYRLIKVSGIILP